MPFLCELKFDDTHLGVTLPPAARVRSWSTPEKAIVEAGNELLVLESASQLLKVRLRFRCFLEHPVAAPGSVVRHGSSLAKLIADGEEIPEEFRYATVEWVSNAG